MDPRMLRYYNRELQHVREMGAEFAAEYPKIAGRLGIDGTEIVSDPYVERLLEGFAFLAARVHLKIDDQFPQFTQHLLEIVYPHYLCPRPSMIVARFDPILEEGALVGGYILPKDTSIRSIKPNNLDTECEYRTGQDLRIWPIEVTEARYFATAGDLASLGLDGLGKSRAGIRVSLRTTGGVAFDQLEMDELRFYLDGTEGIPEKLYEQILGNAEKVVIRPKGGAAPWTVTLNKDSVHAVGFEPDQALYPNPPRSFEGYRILQEYFAFPSRFRFIEVRDLLSAVAQCGGTELEIFFILSRRDEELDRRIDADNFVLNCAPAVNLFPKRTDHVHVDSRNHEFHLVADNTKPMDYEVWNVSRLLGFGTGAAPEQTFLPLYAHERELDSASPAYFSVQRVPKSLNAKQQRLGARASYIGSETYVSLVDTASTPYGANLRRIAGETLCTNRDLPLLMVTGQGQTDYTLDIGAPIKAIRCVAGPTRPNPGTARGDVAWKLINHLSLNYLSLTDTDSNRGVEVLKEMLGLYVAEHDVVNQKVVEGLMSVSTRPINRRLPVDGMIAFARGLEVSLHCDERAFEGTGMFLFGKVMEEFFSKYVSINSFTETRLVSNERGEVMKWPNRLGQRTVM